MTQDLDPGTAHVLRVLSQGARSQDEGHLGTPKMVRWRAEQLDRAGAAAKRLGLSRSAVIRMAFDRGIAEVERSVPADPA